jgi:hypothetical protein
LNQSTLDVVKTGRAVRVWNAVLAEWLYWVRDDGERLELLSDLVYELN